MSVNFTAPREFPGKIPFLVPGSFSWFQVSLGLWHCLFHHCVCLVQSAPQPVSLFVSYLEHLWWWVGPFQIIQQGLFILKLLIIWIFLWQMQRFFSPNKSIWKFCVHYPTHYSNCDIFILIWYFAVTRSLQTQVKRVFILSHSLRALPILEGKTWWQETLLEVFQRNRGAEKRQKLELGYNMVLKVTLCDPLLLMTLHLLAVLQPSETAPAARGHISAWAYEEHFIFKTIKPRQDIYKVQIHRLRCQCTREWLKQEVNLDSWMHR